jgi:hypothetical protein
MVKAQQITVDNIAAVAATGVARAIEARKSAGMDLSQKDLHHVSGGAYQNLINGAILHGDQT